MRHSKIYELLPLDPVIERTCRQNHKEKREEWCQVLQQAQEIMAHVEERNSDNRALKDYAPLKMTGIQYVIRKPTIQANNFEIKLATLQMI